MTPNRVIVVLAVLCVLAIAAIAWTYRPSRQGTTQRILESAPGNRIEIRPEDYASDDLPVNPDYDASDVLSFPFTATGILYHLKGNNWALRDDTSGGLIPILDEYELIKPSVEERDGDEVEIRGVVGKKSVVTLCYIKDVDDDKGNYMTEKDCTH